jgi:hypothetical protein
MKKASVIVILLIVSNIVVAQSNDLLSLLKDQVHAFNNQDVKKLVANVSNDMKYYYLTADELIIETSGREAFKKAMINYFKDGKKPFSVVKNHVIDGSRISFQEIVSHINKKGETVSSSAMGIYQYDEGKIIRAWYFID